MYKIIFLSSYLFLCFFQAKASGSQGIPYITIQFENQSLYSVFCQLEKMSELEFTYQDTIVNQLDIIISQNFKDKTIGQILDVLLANSDYNYVIIENFRVVIYKKGEESSSKTIQNQKSMPFSITGKVVDEVGEFIRGASIYVKGKDANITRADLVNITDEKGSFIISTTNPDACVIVLYIGYSPRIVPVRDAGLIKIEPNAKALNKVIRIG